jgi:hypothetical protein
MKKIAVTKLCCFFSLQSIPLLILLLSATSVKANAPGHKNADVPAIIGRWDITIDFQGKKLPSWLEVHHSGIKTLVGEFVGVGGSARPISKVNFDDGKVSFSIPPQWEQGDGDVSLTGTLQGDALSGTITFSDGKTYNFSAVRAPSLERTGQPVWGKAVQLFDGKDLKGWHATEENQWIVENDVLKSPRSGPNLITDNTFNDFKLHIEFRYPKGSNSGVYLRGRYEMQIEDDEPGQQLKEQLGAIYGFIAPSEKAGKGPGEWQTYDITLLGRMLTVQLNGKTIICDREIPGITGGAINSNEGEPGPLYIQGDHGPIEYKNIVITPAQ